MEDQKHQLIVRYNINFKNKKNEKSLVMDGYRLWASTIINLFSTLNWDWRRQLAFCVHYNNVRHALTNAHAAWKPHTWII